VRTPLNRLERVTGLFVLAVLTVALVALGYGVRRATLTENRFTLFLQAPGAIGAAQGSVVRLYGVPVGTVTEVAIVRAEVTGKNPVRLKVQIQPEYVPMLHADTKATISAGMAPLVAAEILLNSEQGPPLAFGSTLVAEVKPSVVDALTDMATDIGGELRGIIERSRVAIDNVTKVTEELTAGKSAASRMLVDPELGAALGKTVGDSRAAVADARRMLAKIDTAAEHAPQTAANVLQITDDARQLSAQVREMLISAERSLALVEQIAEGLKVTASYAPELVRKADTSLDETNRLVHAAQRNILIRGSIEPKVAPRTEAQVRPPVVNGMPPLPAASAARPDDG
jgi:ABC-type transporter Mla subunit MlaD